MKLDDVERNWDRLATADPLWAILTHADKRGGAWDVAEFFATGRAEISGLLEWVAAAGVQLQREAALDFGCGAGRLTQALGEHFAQVTGVDVATSMIALAQEHNRHGAACRYLHNPHPDLREVPSASIDFACSIIVLQHVEPRLAAGYLRELVRVLRPGGALVVQMPSRPHPTLKGRLRALLARPRLQPLLNVYRRLVHGRPGAMEMYGIPRPRMEALLVGCGAAVAGVRPCDSAGPTWESFRYLAVKAGDRPGTAP